MFRISVQDVFYTQKPHPCGPAEVCRCWAVAARQPADLHLKQRLTYLFLIIWKLVFMYGYYIHPRIIFCLPNLFQIGISLIVICVQLKIRQGKKTCIQTQ